MIDKNNIGQVYDILDVSNFRFNCFLCDIICSRLIDERYPSYDLLRVYAKTQAGKEYDGVDTKDEYDELFYQ